MPCVGLSDVVVVNDGSSDETAEVLRGLPVVVVKHQVNLGQGASLQTGITLRSNAERTTSSPSTPTASIERKTH